MSELKPVFDAAQIDRFLSAWFADEEPDGIRGPGRYAQRLHDRLHKAMQAMKGDPVETPTKTRCKVRCNMISPVTFGPNGQDGQSAYFYATYDSDPNSENGKFFQATPCASIQIGTTNGTPFEAGKEYYIDFVPVEPTVPAETTAS